jgi:hypothetical protein
MEKEQSYFTYQKIAPANAAKNAKRMKQDTVGTHANRDWEHS